MQTILFIDGENFLHKVREVVRDSDLASIDLRELATLVMKPVKIDRIIFYAARLHEHHGSIKKSRELIEFQRRLKSNLEKQGVEFVLAGNVRGQSVSGSKKIIFHEKGVDVRIAVDMISMASDGLIKTAILCSSDSDLQPAIKELRRREVSVIYLGFQINPNKGMTFTTSKTVLIRDAEVLKSVGIEQKL